MKMIRPYRWLSIAVLILAAGTFLFFQRMYRDDIKALKAFMASCQAYDEAISAYVIGGRAGDLDQASANLRELRALSSMRISSLIRNDGELMGQARAIADLAEVELKDYRGLNADPVARAEELEPGRPIRFDSEQRQAAWDRFKDLAGQKGNDHDR